jgi:hypothetical protein
MSSLLDHPTAVQHLPPAERLRATMAATRVSLRWFGVRKTLTPVKIEGATSALSGYQPAS